MMTGRNTMLLGVPVLRRYDFLERLLASAEAGSLKPSGYLVVDNGGEFCSRLEGSDVVQQILAAGGDVRVLEPGGNIGVAAAWNAILDEADDELVIISNDDIELGHETLRALTPDHGGEHPPVILLADAGPDANGWCLFLHSPTLYRKIGPYDESFHPAYYEDSDYRWRMKLEGLEPILVKTEFKHAVRGSWSDDSRKQIRRSLEQFERKWGGTPQEEPILFKAPFDGAPIAYSLRKQTYRGAWRKLQQKICRWDIVNRIAEKIDAKSYLEIGVASGESMRRVKIRWKEGVDPNPVGDAASAANIFYKVTSDEFFDGLVLEPYDVVFIGGLHHADQAYRDIENACKNARVVVVHNTNPSTEAMQRVPYAGGDWTGDTWKAIARVRREGRHTVRTVDTDFGVAVVIPNCRPDEEYGIATDDGQRRPLPAETYADLEAHRKELLGLVAPSGWEAWFDRASKEIR